MKTILHLCADIGSDSYIYKINGYEVIMIGENPGVENYHPDRPIHGVIANPVCKDFSNLHNLNQYNRKPDLSMIKHCQRIIKEAESLWWVIENPGSGKMKDYLGKPNFVYHPWNYGSPWTKKTALWGKFNIPKKLYTNWCDVPKNDKLYMRPGRNKPGFNFLHKSAIYDISEFNQFIPFVKNDSDFRSLCSQGFAKAFFEVNK